MLMGPCPPPSATDRVTLLATRVCTALEDPAGLASDCGDTAERPRSRDLDLVPAPAQSFDRLAPGAFLDRHVPQTGLPGVEARGKRLGVVVRRVDRGLEIEVLVDMAEEDVERPLVLLV